MTVLSYLPVGGATMAKLEIAKGKKPVVKEVEITSVSQYVSKIVELAPPSDIIRTYRGHAKTSYLLKPSLYRTRGNSREEKNILRELVSLHPSEFEKDRSAFDQLVRMQHYSLETRLFDVSLNPLVALYFAAKNNPTEDGNVILFDVEKRSVKYFDSDTVSCIANLSSLSSKERNEIRHFTTDEEFNNSNTGKRLLHFIKTEKPYFLPLMRRDDLHKIVLVKPKQNNRRILAQQGAFFLFGLPHEMKPEEHDVKVQNLVVPAALKKQISNELDLININGSTMFPEIESAAKYIMSKVLPA